MYQQVLQAVDNLLFPAIPKNDITETLIPAIATSIVDDLNPFFVAEEDLGLSPAIVERDSKQLWYGLL